MSEEVVACLPKVEARQGKGRRVSGVWIWVSGEKEMQARKKDVESRLKQTTKAQRRDEAVAQ